MDVVRFGLLAVQLAALLFIAAGTQGWIVRLDKPTTTDFVSFYAAGALADAGTPALAYDHAAHLAAISTRQSDGRETLAASHLQRGEDVGTVPGCRDAERYVTFDAECVDLPREDRVEAQVIAAGGQR